MPRRLLLVSVVIIVAAAGVKAQWLNYPDPRILGTKDGKVNLVAPRPRMNGRPDLSGVWTAEFRFYGNIAVDGVTVPFQPGAEDVFA